jgi:hypothetical protein
MIGCDREDDDDDDERTGLEVQASDRETDRGRGVVYALLISPFAYFLQGQCYTV